ncbi:hypothetical protein CR513_38209, partial [Mucuna pruriens]
MDKNTLDSLFLNIQFHGLDMKEGSIPATLIYRIQYKVMNTYMTKANISLPRTIKWDEVMDKVAPSIPTPAPYIEDIKMNNSGKVEITFNRRKSFSSRIEALHYGYIQLQQELEDDQKSIQSLTYSSINEPYEKRLFTLKKINVKENDFFDTLKFVKKVKINIPFFDWFHAYTIREDIEYPWQIDMIGDPSTNVITTWQIKDGELIQSKLPPITQYQLPKVKYSNDKLVMATPFKTKDVNEDITPKDIKSLMKHTNYTNKYLQVIGESIGKEKILTMFFLLVLMPKYVSPGINIIPVRISCWVKWLRKFFPKVEDQINRLLTQTSEEESNKESSDENSKGLQHDDHETSSTSEEESSEINVLTKEQNLLFEVIENISDPQEKMVFLNQLKRSLEAKPKPKNLLTDNKFDVNKIFRKLELGSASKPTTIQDLQEEIKNLKLEVKNLKNQQDIHSVVLAQLGWGESNDSSENESPQEKDHTNDKIMGLIKKIRIQKFYINIKIVIKDFVLETLALFDTGADSNCILEGLIPTKYFEKTSEKLSTASGSKLKINYKLSKAAIVNQDLRIKTSFLLVKNLKNEVILGTPFIKSLFPIEINDKVKTLNLLDNKIKQINYLKEEVSHARILQQLETPQIKHRIDSVLKNIKTSICLELPNAFWDRKNHMVDLPYEKDFKDSLIPTKARPIQMNKELLLHCQKEIKDLLDKKLIRKSKSP